MQKTNEQGIVCSKKVARTNQNYPLYLKSLLLCIYVIFPIFITILLFTKLILIWLVGWLVGSFVLRRINPFWVIYCRTKFQTIQFTICIIFVYKHLNIKQFYFKQFSLAKVQFSSIWPLDRTLSGATASDLEAMAIKGCSTFSKIPASLEPHH